eukprot:TRINITY_DN49529_c0_g1_i1.p1 TRINITY_DN49529_c0_g1~~TRINITY_DN49529_c0_g1_i1.p1  ORF type:complete len:256 (+),score=-5.68 TRINITY_DN49529_c0_g1_i1:39-770(+)
MASKNLQTIRDEISLACASVLASYRQFCVEYQPHAQLILPESFKLFPLLSLALQKSPAFRANQALDVRVAHIREGKGCGVAAWGRKLHPKCWRLDNLQSVAENSKYDHFTGHEIVRLSFEFFELSGVYLMHWSRELLCWIGPQTPPAVLQALFGVGDMDSIDTSQQRFPILQNALSQGLHALVQEIQREYHRRLSVRVIRSGYDPEEAFFRYMLVQDKFEPQVRGYQEYIRMLHHEVMRQSLD